MKKETENDLELLHRACQDYAGTLPSAARALTALGLTQALQRIAGEINDLNFQLEAATATKDETLPAAEEGE